MGRLSARVTATQTVDTSLAPELKQKVAVKVTAHELLREKIKKLEAEADAIKLDVQALFRTAKKTKLLLDGVKVNGVPVKMVCGHTKRRDIEKIRERMIELGEEDPMWIENNAEEDTPNKPYLKIGGNKKKGEDE